MFLIKINRERENKRERERVLQYFDPNAEKKINLQKFFKNIMNIIVMRFLN